MDSLGHLNPCQLLFQIILTAIFPPLGVLWVFGCGPEVLANLLLMPIPFAGHIYGFYVQYHRYQENEAMEEHLLIMRRRRYAQRIMADVNKKAACDLSGIAAERTTTESGGGGILGRRWVRESPEGTIPAEMAEMVEKTKRKMRRRHRRERGREDVPKVRIEEAVDGGGGDSGDSNSSSSSYSYPPSPTAVTVTDYED